jgi:hypothetical protein
MRRDDDHAYFHEDDYCHRELLPKAAEPFARREAAAIEGFSTAHAAPGGGWTDIYVRDDPPASLRDLNITLDALTECVPPALRRFDRVTSGYGSLEEPVEHAVAWGSDRWAMIFADVDERRVVQNVWFPHFGAESVEDMRAFFVACARRWHLILADWAWTQVVDLRDAAALDTYLALRAQPED